MKNLLKKYWTWGLSLLLGAGVFLFWYAGYPQALSFHEQFQLFLWTGGYMAERLALPGGLADWLSELMVQFYRIEWVGALLLAVVYVALQRLVWKAQGAKPVFLPLSFVPPLLLLWLMGDESVLLSYPVALLLALAVGLGLSAAVGSTGNRLSRMGLATVTVAVLYWAVGPVAWLAVFLLVVRRGWRWLWTGVWLLAVQLAAYAMVLDQWPLTSVFMGLNYYRIPMQWPSLLWGIPLVIVLILLLSRLMVPRRLAWPVVVAQVAGLVGLCWYGVHADYDADRYELIRQDYLIRNERWDEIVERARHKEVKSAFWSNSVNLALAKKRMLADRMFDFWQSGPDALLMGSKRDMMSNLPTAEAFWHLGMVNSAQRYMADIQESILNGRKSGRCEQRIAECYIVNGKYALARKHLNLLKQSLFYRDWALQAEKLMSSEAAINGHPVYGTLRKLRFKEDFLFSYPEKDKVLGRLFMGNMDNKMALDYFIGQLLLNGDASTFRQALPWAQQYGGYHNMPLGYQDVMNCIRQQGNVPGSPYAAFISRMMKQSQNQQNGETYETAH